MYRGSRRVNEGRVRNIYMHTHRETERQRDRETERQRDRESERGVTKNRNYLSGDFMHF
jgi:hypothetical protein